MPGSRAIDVAPRQMTTLADADDAAGSQARSRPNYDGLAASVNQNGCFDFDRVVKCGYVEKRTQKTKKWKSIYMVLRPNTLSMYKNEKETKLRHQVYLSDLTAVAFLKDPKHKRHHVFGLFSPSKNFHFQALSAKDSQEWVELIRRDARIEEEEEMVLAGPLARSPSPNGLRALGPGAPGRPDGPRGGRERVLSSSPETYGPPARGFAAGPGSRQSSNVDSSGNELPSHFDLSDTEGRRPAAQVGGSLPKAAARLAARPLANRSASQASVLNMEQDPDRIVWQGWLWMLRSKGGVRQWKNMWGVLRPRNLILYKDESEYTAQWIVQLSAVVDIVDMDPLSKRKENCLQIITEEKSYRFCTHGEESLVQFIGAFKSLLAKRRGLEARVAAAAAAATS